MPQDSHQKATAALSEIHNALDIIARDCPAVFELIFSLTQRIQNYAKHRNVDPKHVKFGQIKWTNDGYVVFRVEYKGRPLPPYEVHLGT